MTEQTSSSAPGYYRTRVGEFTALALHEGTVSRERAATFVANAPADEVEQAFSRLGFAPGKLTLTFTPLAVEMNGKLVLIDTGLGDSAPPTAGKLKASLQAAGHSPADVDIVIISHFHGDHIAGLVTKDGGPAYPNAKVVVPQPEWDYWMDDKTMEGAPEGLQPNFGLCRRVLGALDGRIEKVNWGDEAVPGITALDAAGHTPGQTAYEIRSGNESLLFVADVTNNPFVFARHPTWQAAFDVQGDKAVETRLRILGDAADKKSRLFFFHAPFPGLGYVTRDGDGFDYVPQIWTAEA